MQPTAFRWFPFVLILNGFNATVLSLACNDPELKWPICRENWIGPPLWQPNASIPIHGSERTCPACTGDCLS